MQYTIDEYEQRSKTGEIIFPIGSAEQEALVKQSIAREQEARTGKRAKPEDLIGESFTRSNYRLTLRFKFTPEELEALNYFDKQYQRHYFTFDFQSCPWTRESHLFFYITAERRQAAINQFAIDIGLAQKELNELIEKYKNPPPPISYEPAPPTINEINWYSHALLLAAPGAGKTNAIRWRITQLIPHLREGKASLILLDPKSVLTHEMLTLARAEGLENRVVFIDPIHAPVSVNIFDKGDGSPAALNETIAHVTRILGTITLALTDMQLPTLTFALRALFSQPEQPSLDGLINILRNGKQVLSVDKLDSRTHAFFDDYLPDRNIIGRLNSMLANHIYETLFATDRPSYDIAKDMQAGRLIIINAGDTETLYGKFWIQEIGRSIRPRLALPEQKRMPIYCIIDEADLFIKTDLHFATILDRAREARIGMLISMQHMGQINDDHVRNSLYNCALKFVARTNADIHNLCRSMGTTDTDFLGTTPQYQFAFFGPNMDSAMRVKLPLIEFAHARQEDIAFFTHRARGEPEPPPPPPPTADTAPVADLALADAYAQLALAIRRQNTARAAELQDHIASLLKRAQSHKPDDESDWKG